MENKTDILKRIERLEKEVFGIDANKKSMSGTGKENFSGSRSGKKSLSNHILELRGREIFKNPMTPEEVHKKLSAIYPCDFSRVKVELIRLQRRGQLRKTSKFLGAKKHVAYVW